jgi:hypothetical protein
MKDNPMRTSWRFFLAAALAFAAVLPARSATEPPDALVRTTVDEVLGVIKQSRDRATLRKLAEQKVVPYFDSRNDSACGRNGMAQATPPAQRELERISARCWSTPTLMRSARPVQAAMDRQVKPAQVSRTMTPR